MRVILDWLRDYTEIPVSVSQLADDFTLKSLESTRLLQRTEFLDSVRVGIIEKVDPHPDADNLAVCQVRLAKKIHQVVCGAPNVAVDQKVSLIQPGTTMPDGNIVEEIVIRGVESHGMLASERELGLSDSHAGIMTLRDEAEPGSTLWDYLSKYWDGLEVDITPNRPDCMSHLGVAREISALYGTTLSSPTVSVAEDGENVDELAAVEIEEPDKCPRYAARVIRNVSIEPSPLWLQQRLCAIGLRPINNIVDISNYVLMETGHPLHTFDYDKLAQNRIVVRSARAGESFTTLDGKIRELNEEILLICDAEQPVAIAGIMGGENSEVTEETNHILIESAYFNPVTVRRGSKFLGLSTEASKRFERGTDPRGVIDALNRITALIQEIAGGEVAEGVIDEYPAPVSATETIIRTSRTNAVLGTTLNQTTIKQILDSLEFSTYKKDDDTLTVTVPTFRPDITREIDLIEEVLRIHGMENVPQPQQVNYAPQVITATDTSLHDEFARIWRGFGFNRAFSNSLLKGEYTYPDLTGKTSLVIRNPLGKEMSYMRTTLLPLLVDAVIRNTNRKENNIRLFEIGRVFSADEHQETGAAEFNHFAAIATGNIHPRTWGVEEKKIDFYRFKGYIEAALEVIELSGLYFERLNSDYFQPGFQLTTEGNRIGYGGQIQSNIFNATDLPGAVFAVELNFDALRKEAETATQYEKPSDYPAIERDLSLVVEENLPADELTGVIVGAVGELLREVRLYDVYTGDQIPEGHKSLTYSLKFQSPERTLTEQEIDHEIHQILNNAAKNTNAVLRED